MTKNQLLRLDIQHFAEKIDPLSPVTTIEELQNKIEELPTYPGDILFPDGERQFEMSLQFIKGVGGLPVDLAPSEFDSRAPIRERLAIEGFKEDMPIFRDSHKMTERQLREYKMAEAAASSGDNSMKNALNAELRKVYNDRLDLLRGGRSSNERMKMQVLSTGKIGIYANDKEIDIDYNFADEQFLTATADEAFSNPDADVFGLFDKLYNQASDTGVSDATLNTMMMTSKTLGLLTKNKGIIAALTSNNQVKRVTRQTVKALLEEEYNVTIIVNDNKSRDRDTGEVKAMFPDNVVSLFPSGELGEMKYAYTTEELAFGDDAKAPEVEVSPTGLTLFSELETHVPNQNVIGVQICMPTFERADEVFILNTEPVDEGTP